MDITWAAEIEANFIEKPIRISEMNLTADSIFLDKLDCVSTSYD